MELDAVNVMVVADDGELAVMIAQKIAAKKSEAQRKIISQRKIKRQKSKRQENYFLVYFKMWLY